MTYSEFKDFVETKSAYRIISANQKEGKLKLENKRGVSFEMQVPMPYDNAILEMKKHGIRASFENWTIGEKVVKATKVSRAGGSKKRITKSREEVDHTPIALKKREETADQEAIPVVNHVSDKLQHEAVLPVEGKAAVPTTIDYDVKAPREMCGYFFPQYTQNILTRVKIGRNVLLTGQTGTGKSEFVLKLAKLLKQRVIRVNLSIGTTEGHLVGKFVAKDGSTQFVYGIVPVAMKLGWWLLLDEIDYAQPEHLAVLQPILEGDNLLIVQNENEEVKPHPNFRIFATANTKGRGDETQSYVGTNFLNMAFLDRWSIFELEYTKQEPKIVERILNKDEKLAAQLNQFFTLLRSAIDNGELNNMAFSTRRLEQVAEMLAFGEPLKDVLEYELFSRYDKHEIEIMREFAYEVWDRTHYLSGNWAIGEKHFTPPVTV